MANRDFNRLMIRAKAQNGNVTSGADNVLWQGQIAPVRCKIRQVYICASAALTATAGHYHTWTIQRVPSTGTAATLGTFTGQTSGSGGHGNLTAGLAERIDNGSASTLFGTVTIEAGDTIRAKTDATGNGKLYVEPYVDLICEPFDDK